MLADDRCHRLFSTSSVFAVHANAFSNLFTLESVQSKSFVFGIRSSFQCGRPELRKAKLDKTEKLRFRMYPDKCGLENGNHRNRMQVVSKRSQVNANSIPGRLLELPGNFGGVVRPAPGNPYPISDQNM